MNPFDAIESAIHQAYPGTEFVFCDPVKARTKALNGFVVVRVPDLKPYWLIVSQGFTELWDKEGGDPKVSGWGFELTCRVPVPTADYNFGWVLHWMQHIADTLEESQSWFEAGHSQQMIESPSPNELGYVVFAQDVHLQSTLSANGRFEFLQMVGLNKNECEGLRAWHSDSFINLMKAHDPLLLMDNGRPSLLDNEDFARQVEEGQARDGSSVGGASGVDVLWFEQGSEIEIHLSLDAARIVERAVANRLRHKWPMILMGDNDKANARVVLEPHGGPARVETRGGISAAIVPLNAFAQTELVEALGTAHTSKAFRRSISLENAPSVRFVISEPEDFTDNWSN